MKIIEDIKLYNLTDLVEEMDLYNSKNNDEFVLTKEYKDSRRDYFRLFLDEICVPDLCFKNQKSEWTFNEDGRYLFLNFQYNLKKEPYKSMRNGKFKAEYKYDYSWIINTICSNLNTVTYLSLKTRNDDNDDDSFYYPKESDVRLSFWSNIMSNLPEQNFVLPGISYIIETFKEYSEELIHESEIYKKELEANKNKIIDMIKTYRLNDLIYLDYKIQVEFEELEAQYLQNRKLTMIKWLNQLDTILTYRRKEASEVAPDLTLDLVEKFVSIIEENTPDEPTYTKGLSRNNAWQRNEERHLYNNLFLSKLLNGDGSFKIEEIEEIAQKIKTPFMDSEKLYKKLFNDDN